ncbi:error-prone DNA polymerase [Chitinimonas arctica]|uniref:Error-prone DNA polymerase n=1 Tax=Chitinimonas arctica TaxID=2594795 RepID=A0A516SGA2_9NEIS|nr:error-prone DNA polymerase [Chitinimonas arctica]QDQ27191.1 error-prone DNA polymerase [Chitinimonas arctica]
MLPDYAELHCLSNFSFQRGASHAEELVERAQALGYRALAITDECSLAGIVRAHVAAKEAGLALIVGSEFTLVDGLRLVLLAPDREAYGDLSSLISLGRRQADKGSYRLDRADVARLGGRLLALWLPPAAPHAGDGDWLRACFPDRAWLAVELLQGPADQARLAALSRLAAACRLPCVASGDVHMHLRSRRVLQDLLTAIRLGRPVAQCGQALFPNGERHLRARPALALLYPAAMLAETVRIAERCHFSLDSLRYEYPDELVPAGYTASQYLAELTEAGFRERYPQGVPSRVRQQVADELALIAELGYEHYFLTVDDIVRFARSRDILCQGRGSAANSAVCYVLGITAVDPSRMNMLFGRFLSRERSEPPDIDVDFEHDRREEVIQYLYRKYGRERAALTATVITYRPRSAMRDVGRALGIAEEQLDRLAKTLAWWDKRTELPARLAEAGFDPDSRQVQLLLKLVMLLLRFPRHLSQHVGGFVFSRGPLARLVPIENAAMPERTVIQWDKDDLDSVGLLKVDVLALGMLSAIRRSLALVSAIRQAPFRLGDIPAEDPLVYAMLGQADTVGVFQVESRAQMSMLPRLKPVDFYDLVIEVAIVRPGPIQGGMVHPYLRRRQGLEIPEVHSKEVAAVLDRTLGIPIFQEQVMQLAVVAAGFTAGEADQLRRSMAAWRRTGKLEPFRDKLTSGMLQNGYSAEFAQRIFSQIQGFSEYGFPESHAASFALLVYASAWLKRHEPAAFLCSLLNAWPMGFYSPSQLVQDAQRHGVTVLPVDILCSDWECSLEDLPLPGASPLDRPQPSVRLGLRLIKGLSQAAGERIAQLRGTGIGDLANLQRQAQLDKRELNALAAAGALGSLAGHRRSALWQVSGLQVQEGLLAELPGEEAAVTLPAPTVGQDIVADYASMGLTLGPHPLSLLRARLTSQHLLSAAEILQQPPNATARAAGLVVGRQRPDTATGVTFVTLEDETGNVNVIVWRELAEHQRKELLGARLLLVYGQIQREGNVVHLLAKRLVDRSEWLGELGVKSRDFH